MDEWVFVIFCVALITSIYAEMRNLFCIYLKSQCAYVSPESAYHGYFAIICSLGDFGGVVSIKSEV